MFSFVKRHKIVSVVILLNLILIAVVIAVIVMHNAKTATVDIKVAPLEAEIRLNGQRYDNFQSYDVLPGEYRVEISMEGMETKEYDITLENNGFERIKTYLVGVDGGFDYYLRHPEAEAVLAQVIDDSDTVAKEFVEKYESVSAIADILPYNYDAYVDNYAYYVNYEIAKDERDDCRKIVCLRILDYTGGNEQAAINTIIEQGFNPDDYEIVYEEVLYSSVRASDE